MPESDRWIDDRTHIYDYTPDAIARAGDRDAFYVARGFVYSKDGRVTVGFGVLVSAQDLRTETSRETWIQQGRALRDRLIEKHSGQVRRTLENQSRTHSGAGY